MRAEGLSLNHVNSFGGIFDPSPLWIHMDFLLIPTWNHVDFLTPIIAIKNSRILYVSTSIQFAHSIFHYQGVLVL